MRRVVLVLADGLRPDAITPTDMPSLDALSRRFTTALRASTVRPSRTVAALASLATGVAPDDVTGFAVEILSLVISPQRRADVAAAARAAAVARDVAPENLELLRQYAEAAGLSSKEATSCAA